MRNLMNYKFFTLLVLSFALSACGGGSSDPIAPPVNQSPTPEPVSNPEPVTPAEPTTYTGVFIDSAVQGLNYKTATQEGTTNAQGEFIYQLGETITFSIGGIEFPSVEVKTEITPLDIFKTDDTSHVGVVNMLQLLQSLDDDAMPENGITLREEIHTLAANFSVDFNDNNFESLVNAVLASYSGVNNSLINEQTAIAHFENTLMLNQPMPSSCGNDHEKVGYSGNFSTLFHDVSGKVTILDNCTLQVENFNYDATAPVVYFYGDISPISSGVDSGTGFNIGEILRDDSVAYVNDSITLKLPNNRTLDDLEYLSVWCVDFLANFGDLQFQAP